MRIGNFGVCVRFRRHSLKLQPAKMYLYLLRTTDIRWKNNRMFSSTSRIGYITLPMRGD